MVSEGFRILPLTSFAQLDESFIDATLKDEIEKPWARSWIAAEADGTIVGVLSTWLVLDELHVLHIATHPARRRCGFAKALLAHALNFARISGVHSLFLETRRSNHAALSLYEQCGFAVCRVRARYYSDDEDAIEMMLSLDGQSDAMAKHV